MLRLVGIVPISVLLCCVIVLCRDTDQNEFADARADYSCCDPVLMLHRFGNEMIVY